MRCVLKTVGLVEKHCLLLLILLQLNKKCKEMIFEQTTEQDITKSNLLNLKSWYFQFPESRGQSDELRLWL